jgi:hypothetical protein
VLWGYFLQKYDCRAWTIWMQRYRLYRNLRTTSFKSRALGSSGICCLFRRAPTNKWLDSAHERVLLFWFLFLDFKIDFIRFEFHESDIAKLMNIVDWWGLFKLHIIRNRYGFLLFLKTLIKLKKQLFIIKIIFNILLPNFSFSKVNFWILIFADQINISKFSLCEFFWI